MTPFPTFASLSSYPVGLFYSTSGPRLSKKRTRAGSNPALTDGGQSSVRNLLSISRWRKAGGVF